MLTAESLKKANEQLKKTPIKGKDYAQVNERVRVFRDICPGGSITTDILSLENGVVTMQATVKDENGQIIATGLAYEKEGSTYINKTSFIENCETSAVGRALGFAGIGIDESMASAEELANAILNQSDNKPQPKESEQAKKPAPKKQEDDGMTEEEYTYLLTLMARKGIDAKILCSTYKVESLITLTHEQYENAIARLNKSKDKE